jgi:hypothetical protein
MALFGRKKNEDEDDDEEYLDDEELEIEDKRKERKITRKFRDLRPENRKKRKEPPKPWGKKERLTILIILVSSVLIAGILAISNQAHISFNLTKPSFEFDFSKLNPFKEETIEIRKK